MMYHLLTGATGLLGSYLLRDCLRAGHCLAVLVRSSKSESARQRIESVLQFWESELRVSLPRPVVIEGDLTEEGLGLDSVDRRWLARHCCSVIHNAASLTFHGNDYSSEPWLSNFGGTRKVLELCRTTKIRQFHYISTAFVCGLRSGKILETELDVGQQLGNAYEKSKLEAEKLVLAAEWLERPTIYRPAIIVGDSQTGYTSTFHGFYVMVRLAHTLVSRMRFGSTRGSSLVRGMGMTGNECKNLVPVDWVSAAFNHIFSRSQYHGRTYHLTNHRPPSLGLIAEVIQQAVEECSKLADEKDAFVCTEEWFLENFREQLKIYQSYWREDPQFDNSQLQATGAPLCPTLDAPLLLKLAKYAIKSNFGRNGVRKPKRLFDISRQMRNLCQNNSRVLSSNLTGQYCLGLDVRGPTGGQWKLKLQDGRLLEVEEGLSRQCSAVLRLEASTFRLLRNRKMRAVEALRTGRVVINGNGLEPVELAAILEAAAVNGNDSFVESAN